jgi:hypothetical protein
MSFNSSTTNPINNIGNRLKKTTSNIQNTLTRLSTQVKNTGSQFLTNTRNYQNRLNQSIQQASINTTQEGGGLIYFLLGLLMILLLISLLLAIYYVLTDCQEKKTFYDYIWDPTNPCIRNGVNITTGGNGTNLANNTQKGLNVDISIPSFNQVFHIANQDYTYDQAKCKCGVYGARLATQAEITDAYNKGADWCTYGWSAGQQAFYPTQAETARRRGGDCGKAGVNGGFFANPILKFGVNCYGIKPEGEVVRPKNRDLPFCARENNFQAANKLDTDKIAPFNESKWSQPNRIAI